MDELIKYIKPEILAFVPVVYAIGEGLKKLDWIKNKYIPLALMIICIILSCGWCLSFEGFSWANFGCGVVQGVLLAAVTVFGNQLYKQAKKKE